MFDIKDDQGNASFPCQSQSMPYNDVVDPLDFAARSGRCQLGDDEPAEIRTLGAKAKHQSP